MRALALALLLASSPTPVSKARELAKSESWVELYLAFSAGDPGEYKAAERKELAGLLTKGARALETSDAVMAFSLAERGCAFEESSDGLLLLAKTALATDQRASAEKALTRGAEKFPRDGVFAVLHGKLLLDERDPAGAARVLEKVPAKSKQYKEARALLEQARAALAEEQAAERQARAVERRIYGGEEGQGARPAGGGPGETGEVRGASLTYESGVGPGGMRTRGNSRFIFRYFNNERDFGQRADYEGRVASALEEAYTFTKRILGEAREAPVDVVLYSREEFMTHHGAGMAQAVAGFYSDNAIRMNDAAEMSQSTKATLVHEYVHAAVDEFAGGNAQHVPRWVNEGIAEYVEWRYLGSDNPPLGIGRRLRGAAVAGRLPSLMGMTDRALIEQADPSLAYGTAAVAVKLLLKKGGVENFLGMLREVGGGAPFEAVLEDRYGRSLARLNEEVADELKSR